APGRAERSHREELGEPFVVDLARDRWVREERLRLRAEDERRSAEGIEERLDPEPIAREKELLARAVPDAEREHAVEALDARRAPLHVRPQEDLGVRTRDEPMAEARELVTKLDEVVDLARVGEHALAPRRERARHRLLS